MSGNRLYRNLSRLTQKQIDILNLFANGLTTDEVCNSLNITRNSLRNYFQDICIILDVKGRAAAINEWNRRRKETINNA